MQSTGAERRGLIVLLSIIAILIITALLIGFFRSRGATTVVPTESKVKVLTVQPNATHPRSDTTATALKRRRSGPTSSKSRQQRQYRQRDFYEETLD